MSFSKDLGIGIRTYSKALDIIFSKGLAWFFIFPVILNIILFWGGLELIDVLIEYLNNLIFNSSGLQDAEFWGSSVLKTATSGIVWVILKIVFYFVFAYLGGYIVLIVMSPALAILSEKTDKILTGNSYPFSAEQTMRDIVRGVLLAIRNMAIEIGLIIALFILGYLPIVGWFIVLISTFLLLFISAYFYGFSFIDYSNERKRRNIKQSISFIKMHRGLAIGNGIIFSLVLLIPWCGTSLAGFIAIVSVVAATVAVNEIDTKSDVKVSIKQN